MSKQNKNFKNHNCENEGCRSKPPQTSYQFDRIKETSSSIIKSDKYSFYCMTIIGEIEGHNLASEKTKTTKYEHMIPQLVSIEENPKIDGLLILLNTVGGDIEAGLALAELISGMKKRGLSVCKISEFDELVRME